MPPIAPDRAAALAAAAATVIGRAVGSPAYVPGVVAGVTDARDTLYVGAVGTADPADGTPMATDSVLAIQSVTKALTATTVLQLVEDGRIDLDAPAARYAPELDDVQVLIGFDDAGRPRLRPPVRPVTTRHLLLHTAGFAYDFFDADYRRLARAHGQPPVAAATRAALRTPLLFDPGERWNYGSSMDWAGQVVEGVTGLRLGDAMRRRVLDPLGMADTAFAPTAALRGRLATTHRRRADGTLTPVGPPPAEPEVDMGGHGLLSTVPDLLRFLRMWLADGMSGSGEVVLRPQTVRFAAAAGLDGLPVSGLVGVNPALSHDVEFFPGLPKSWAYSFLITEADAPTGRRAGSLSWAGLSNLYYWIDRTTGVAGIWAAQLFPFADPACLQNYLEMETAVYDALRG